MPRDFRQIDWDDACREDCLELVRLAVREDLGREQDWTTLALVPHDAAGRAAVVVRQAGVIAGLPAAETALAECDPRIVWTPQVDDGATVEPGTPVALLDGPARSLLTAERLMLNLLGRLSGIAALTRQYVDAVTGTGARIYDTRKTTPGWRRLEKYAVRKGGGWNHRLNLYEAVLIKDNHLAFGATSPAEAVQRARGFLAGLGSEPGLENRRSAIIEVEVDTLPQLADVLPAGPDIVLLDNMTPSELRKAVALRDSQAPAVQLEASGGISLQTVAEVAGTGVERISVGGLTHGAVSLDVGLDWQDGPLAQAMSKKGAGGRPFHGNPVSTEQRFIERGWTGQTPFPTKPSGAGPRPAT